MDWAWGFWGVIVLAVGIHGSIWPSAFRDWSFKSGQKLGLSRYTSKDALPLGTWRLLGWVWIASSAILFWLALGHPVKR